MILTCPECSTRYHVDVTAVGAEGRTVRCANCGHRWTARPPADTPKVVELNAPSTEPVSPLRPVAASKQGRDRGSISLIAWLVGVLVALIMASLIIGRDEIVAGFPATAVVYDKLGLPVTMQLGLQFEGVTSKRLDEGGVAVLVVEGEIVNITDHGRPVPPIRITLLDDGGRQLQQELVEADVEELAAGGRTAFSGRVVNPAERARNFRVTFAIDS